MAKKARQKKINIFGRVTSSLGILIFFLLVLSIGMYLLSAAIIGSKIAVEYEDANNLKNVYLKAINGDNKSKSFVEDYVSLSERVDYIEYKNNDEVLYSFGKKKNYNHKFLEYYISKSTESNLIQFQMINFSDFKMFEKVMNELATKNISTISDEEFEIGNEAVAIPVVYIFDLDNGLELDVVSEIFIYNYDAYEVLFYLIFMVFVTVVILFWIVSILIDIIREYRNNRRLYYTDIISGGNNLQFFYDKARKILSKRRKKYYHYAIVNFGLDKYRSYCTCYGMEKGKELVQKIDSKISTYIRRQELVSHIDKADFALLLGFDTHEKLENRLKAFADVLRAVDDEWEARFKMGIYLVEPDNVDIEGMLNYAGVALTACNDSGSSLCYFTGSMKDESIWINTVENDMQRAIDNNEFQVYLQPKYSTKDEVLSGAEALVRWQHPEKGFISPGKFIPIFENNGFILKLDDFMLKSVAAQQAKWLAEGKKLVPISVNVSRAHFMREDLAEHICKIVDEYNVPHEFIELEVTESSFFDDKNLLISTVKKLKEYGFEISMDDFGAGYSSLNSLKEIPLDVLKLDAEFFRGDDDSGRGDIIVGEAITLAKKLDMRIVAEGIETREQVKKLAEKDCDLIQGFYFAKPMPIDEFEKKAYGGL